MKEEKIRLKKCLLYNMYMYNFNLIDESKPCLKILIMIQKDKSKDKKETRRKVELE